MATDRTHESILLMSNASCDVYPENKPHHFTVRLASPLTLTGKWECGMSVILYPNKWQNIRSDHVFKYCWQTKDMVSNSINNVEVTSNIRAGYFENVASLVDLVNQDIQEKIITYMNLITQSEVVKTKLPAPDLPRTHPKIGGVEMPYFKYVNDSTKIVFTEAEFHEFTIKIVEGKDIIRALGYNPTITQISESVHFKFYPSLTMNFPALYVYSPFLSAWRVGDTAAPLLALVPIHGKYNHYGENEPNRLHYRDVSQNYINEIEIKIVDVHGKEVKFGDGIVALELDFRRVA